MFRGKATKKQGKSKKNKTIRKKKEKLRNTYLSLFFLSFIWFDKDIAGNIPGHVRDIFGTCSGHLRDMFEIFPGHVRDMFWTFSGHVRDMFETCLEHDWNMVAMCLGFVRDIWHIFADIFKKTSVHASTGTNMSPMGDIYPHAICPLSGPDGAQGPRAGGPRAFSIYSATAAAADP